MTKLCDDNRNTKDEWLAIIEQAEKGIPSTFTQYKAPELGSEDFAKSIDHTLLKLETTKSQIDELCDEAKKHNFKVNEYSSPNETTTIVSSLGVR